MIHAYIEVIVLDREYRVLSRRARGLTHKRQRSPRWVELAGANLPIFLLADRPAIAEFGATKATVHDRPF